MPAQITFARLPQISPAEIRAHMSDPRLAAHMPLLTGTWDADATDRFVAAKERCWHRDGLGHWAFLADGAYVGWGGFQKEGADWDYGLVLKPTCFGLGMRISHLAMAFARADVRIPSVTFLLPTTWRKLGALRRMGATFEGRITLDGAEFLKYRLLTDSD